jgi:hypothetical protein
MITLSFLLPHAPGTYFGIWLAGLVKINACRTTGMKILEQMFRSENCYQFETIYLLPVHEGKTYELKYNEPAAVKCGRHNKAIKWYEKRLTYQVI